MIRITVESVAKYYRFPAMTPLPYRAETFSPVLLVWLIFYLVHYFRSERDPSSIASRVGQDIAKGNSNSAVAKLEKLIKLTARKQGNDSIELAVHLRELAQVLQSQGKWREARATMQRSLSIEEKNLGPGSVDLVSTMYWLITQPEAQDDTAANIALMRRVVGINAIVRGTEDFEYGAALNFLGVLLMNCGQYQEAENVTREAAVVLEKHRERQGPAYATTLSNLALLLMHKNDPAAAEELHRRALAVWDEPANSTDPGVTFTLEGLASVLRRRQSFTEAEVTYRRLLLRKEEELGRDHIELVETLVDHGIALKDIDNLDAATETFKRAEDLQVQVPNGALGLAYIVSLRAALERKRGALPEALALMRRVISLRRSALAADNPSIAQALAETSWLLWQLRELVEAEKYMRESIQMLEPLPDYLANKSDTMFNLGVLLKEKGDHAAAEAMLWKVLKLEEDIFGPENFDYATTLHELGLLRAAQGDLKVAETLIRQSLGIREKLLKPSDILLAATSVSLAGVLTEKGSVVEREALLRRALWIYQQALGSDHHTVGATLLQLGRVLHHRSRFEEAEPLYRRALKIAERTFGPDHANTGIVIADLGSLLEDRGDSAGGRLLLTRALSIAVKAFGPEHPTTVSIRERLSSAAFRTAAPHMN